MGKSLVHSTTENNMSKLITFLLLAVMAFATGYASAATTVNFGAASSCPTYCTGFTTDNPAYTLNWLNATYALTSPQHTLLAVNGVTYSGATTALPQGTVNGHAFYQVSGVLQASDGSTVTINYALQYWTTRVVSGRDAGHIVQHRAIDGGALTL
jgi:hypothetical protein